MKQTSLNIYHLVTLSYYTRTRELHIPVFCDRVTPGKFIDNDHDSVPNHKNVDAIEQISPHTIRCASKYTKKQKTDGNLRKSSADHGGHFHGKGPFKKSADLLWCQILDVLAQAIRYLQAAAGEGNETADLFKKWSYE
jgi:hypothetical protein